MFTPRSDAGFVPARPGIDRRTLCHGERTLLVEFRLRAGSTLPRHSHPHEQTGTLVRGRMRLTIGDTEHDVWPGDSWCIAAGVEHSATILEDSTAIEVFSPVREDYLPADARKPDPVSRAAPPATQTCLQPAPSREVGHPR